MSGYYRKNSPQQVMAKERGAKMRQCPKCGRKSALVRVENNYGRGRVCRWDDCVHVASWLPWP